MSDDDQSTPELGAEPIPKFTWPGLANPPFDTRTKLEVAAQNAWASGKHKPTRGADPFEKPVTRGPGRPPKAKPEAPATQFAGSSNPFTGASVKAKTTTKKQINFVDPDSLVICRDPLPKGRVSLNKYGAVFGQMKDGDCLKCEPEEVGQLANGLRKWMSANDRVGQVRTVKFYPTDSKGRVWLLAPVKGAK